MGQMVKDMEARKLLDRLYREGRDKDFLLACFCNNEPTCHRSVVGGLLLGTGSSISYDEEYPMGCCASLGIARKSAEKRVIYSNNIRPSQL